MSLNLGTEELLSRFDGLVANGIITHHPSQVTEFEDNGFRVRCARHATRGQTPLTFSTV